jgi:hypothetical protein
VGGGRLLLLAYFVPCSIAFLCALKAWVQWKELSKIWSYAFLLSWFFVPLVAGIVISLWQLVLRDRYFIICLPPLVLLAAKDGILFYLGRGRFGFDYYVRRLNPEAQTWQILFPEPYDWTNIRGEAMAQPSDSLVRTIPKGYERVWLVLWHNNWKPQIHTTLQANFPHTREQEFRGVQILLYQK